jgi:hypothetical protein
MGLDSYLEARRYVSGWSHSKEEEKAIFKTIVESVGLQDIHDERFATVAVNVAYWRKANHIHNWFVQNVQDGKDDCGQYRVTREQLMELEELCRKVSKDGTGETASKLLPTSTGFFFGTDEYDEYYFEETDNTAKRLGEILDAISDQYDFYYQASW